MDRNGKAQPVPEDQSDTRLDVEVPARPVRRRSYTAKFKLKVLEATDQLTGGEIGRYLRREGLYWSHLTAWRRARTEGVLTALTAQKSGRKPQQEPQGRRIAQLERDNARLEEELRQVNVILQVQKKVLTLFTPTRPCAK